MKRRKILAILLASVVAAASMGGAVYAAKEQRVDLTEQEVDLTEQEVDLTEQEVDLTEQEVDLTEQEVDLTEQIDTEEGTESDDQVLFSVSDIEIDNEQAFEDFARMILGLGGNAGISLLSSESAKDRLTEEEQEIYDIMYDHIAGEDGVAIKGGNVGIAIEFTGSSDWVKDSVREQYEGVERAYKAISYDCAEYMYWHSGSYHSDLEYAGKSLTITFYPYASPKYGTGTKHIEEKIGQDGETYFYTNYDEVDPTEANKLLSIKENVDKIINDNKSKSPYDKLKAYGDEISRLVEYDYEAVKHDKYDGPSSDGYNPVWSFENIEPWQLINVFDGDPSTNVVCEGYSKAFKYLCDLGAPEVDCILVTGDMDGGTGAGGHMWNNVRMNDGQIYLVDITNADDGDAMTVDNPLFVRPYDPGMEPDSYLDVFVLKTESGPSELEIQYQYYSQLWADENSDGNLGGYFSMEDMFGEEWLTLSSTPYDPTTPPSPDDEDDDESDDNRPKDTGKSKSKKTSAPAYTINQLMAISILGKDVTPATYGQKMGSFSRDARNKAMEIDYKFFEAYATWSGSNYDNILDLKDAIMNMDKDSSGTMPGLKLSVTGLDAYARLQNTGFIAGLLDKIGMGNPHNGPSTLNISVASTPGIVTNNPQNYPTIVIKTDKWISFNKETLTAFENSGKAVLVIYKHNGEPYYFLIPAGYPASTLANAEGYAGFNYIRHIMESMGIVVASE